MVVSGDNRETRCSGCSILLYIYGIRQKERNTNKKFVRIFLIRTRHTFMVCHWICAGSVSRRFLPNAPRFLPTHRNFHGKNAATLGLQCFTRRHTFRNSVKVQHTQRDKRGSRYAALISAAAAHLLHYF